MSELMKPEHDGSCTSYSDRQPYTHTHTHTQTDTHSHTHIHTHVKQVLLPRPPSPHPFPISVSSHVLITSCLLLSSPFSCISWSYFTPTASPVLFHLTYSPVPHAPPPPSSPLQFHLSNYSPEGVPEGGSEGCCVKKNYIYTFFFFFFFFFFSFLLDRGNPR